jgi:hypothetical protein
MTDMLTDDIALETTATDIRVFGKWSGAEVQISDMSLEVCRRTRSSCSDDRCLPLGLGLHPWRQAAQVSSALGWSLSSETLSKGIVSDRRTSRLLVDVPRTQQWQEAHGRAHRATHI